jgi:predicted nucleic acid-binding protein
METVFLDTNVLWTAAIKEFSTLRHLWNIPGTRLVTSEYAAEEARRNLENYPASAAEQKRLLKSLDALLLKMAVVPTPYPLPEDLDVNLPAKDIPILAAALSAKAAFLITGDKQHFGAYFGKKMRDITILRPADYLKPWTLNCGRHLRDADTAQGREKEHFTTETQRKQRKKKPINHR